MNAVCVSRLLVAFRNLNSTLLLCTLSNLSPETTKFFPSIIIFDAPLRTTSPGVFAFNVIGEFSCPNALKFKEKSG